MPYQLVSNIFDYLIIYYIESVLFKRMKLIIPMCMKKIYYSNGVPSYYTVTNKGGVILIDEDRVN